VVLDDRRLLRRSPTAVNAGRVQVRRLPSGAIDDAWGLAAAAGLQRRHELSTAPLRGRRRDRPTPRGSGSGPDRGLPWAEADQRSAIRARTHAVPMFVFESPAAGGLRRRSLPAPRGRPDRGPAVSSSSDHDYRRPAGLVPRSTGSGQHRHRLHGRPGRRRRPRDPILMRVIAAPSSAIAQGDVGDALPDELLVDHPRFEDLGAGILPTPPQRSANCSLRVDSTPHVPRVAMPADRQGLIQLSATTSTTATDASPTPVLRHAFRPDSRSVVRSSTRAEPSVLFSARRRICAYIGGAFPGSRSTRGQLVGEATSTGASSSPKRRPPARALEAHPRNTA